MSSILECLKSLYENDIVSLLRKNNTIEFDSGDYLYVEYSDGKLYAGPATNAGIMHDFEIDYDDDLSPEQNIQALYDKVIEEKPEFLKESLPFDESALNETEVTSDGTYLKVHKKDGSVEKFEPADYSADEALEKFKGIMKHSVGRAWQWLKNLKKKGEPIIEANITLNGYTIQDSGSGWVVRDPSGKKLGEFATDTEATEFVENLAVEED